MLYFHVNNLAVLTKFCLIVVVLAVCGNAFVLNLW
jgi:hypothetical protein